MATPGGGEIGRVSIWTPSPGFPKLTFPGLRMAWARFPGRDSSGELADQGGNRLNRSATDEGADNACDSGVGGGKALFAQDRAELLLAPMG
jgi:hypothetical protein